LRFFIRRRKEAPQEEEGMKMLRWGFVFVALGGVLLHVSVPAAARTDRARTDRARPIEVVFTKWTDTTTAPGFRLLRGFAWGDAAGDLTGQVMVREVSYDGRIVRLEAEYAIDDGERSFTALLRGGTDTATGRAILDGVVLRGWRTGAAAHVEFETIQAPSPTAPACQGHPPGLACNSGTIRIGRIPGN
jgi:hypothetical protein